MARTSTGKTQIRIKLNKHHHLGYHFSDTSIVRHRHLNKLVKEFGYASTIRRVNAIRTLLKNNSPKSVSIATKDIQYLQRKYRGKK